MKLIYNLKYFICLLNIQFISSQQIDSDKIFSTFGFDKKNSIECPPLTSTCESGKFNYYPNMFSAPECWLKINNGYSCIYLDDYGLIECPKCYINVGFCGYPVFSKNQTLPSLGGPSKGKEPEITGPKKEEGKVTIPNQIKPINKCPSPDDECQYDDGVKVKFSNSLVPQCWGVYDNNFVCIAKSNGKCPSGYLDIAPCLKKEETKPPEGEEPVTNKCPTLEDICYFEGSVPVTIQTKGGPKCWKYTNNGFECNVGKKGKCESGFMDVKSCIKSEKDDTGTDLKVPQYCPPLSVSCTYNPYQSFKLTDKSPPECWINTISGYACKYKRELNGKCPIGTIDTTPCRPGVLTDSDDELECPKTKVKCLYRQSVLFEMDQPDVPECWAKTPNGYVCRYKSEIGGICPLNVLDITSCNTKTPNTVDKNCPSSSDKCNYNNIGLFSAQDSKAPECWIKTASSFYCRFKKEFNGVCPSGSVDLSICPVTSFLKEACPKAEDSCQSRDKIYEFTEFDIPECWAKVNGNYQCRFKAEFGGKCPNLSKDVSICEVPNVCPKYNTKCKTNIGIEFKIQDRVAPVCWKRGKTIHECKGRGFLGTNCEVGYLDISKCDRGKPPPPCPKSQDFCSYSNDIKYNSLDKNAPECWILDKNNNYDCKFAFEMKDNKCSSNYIDIKRSCINSNEVPNVGDNTNNCPIAGSRCLYNQNGFILLGTPHSPECWINTPNGYVCKYKSELPNFQCNEGAIDTTLCLNNPKSDRKDSFMEESNYFNPYTNS